MKELVQEMKTALEDGEEIALVTIIASFGSTPRGAGSRMLVKRDGSIKGSIGGGAAEYQAGKAALEAIREKRSMTKEFSLTRNRTADIGMICGGDITVYIQYVSPEDHGFCRLCEQMLEAMQRDEDSWLLLDITEKTGWKMGLYSKSLGLSGIGLPGLTEEKQQEFFRKQAVQKNAWGRNYFIAPLVRAGTVYIFGGGHVARELVRVLSYLHFCCVVMDDREEFATKERFPQAGRTIVGDLQHIADYVHINPWDYVCIMTRGHQYDYYVQKQVLPLNPCYIGIMGSKRKIAVTTEKLLQDGFSMEEIRRCHMPIGLEIAAETPEEIAVSIAGELILVRAGRNGTGTHSCPA